MFFGTIGSDNLEWPSLLQRKIAKTLVGAAEIFTGTPLTFKFVEIRGNTFWKMEKLKTKEKFLKNDDTLGSPIFIKTMLLDILETARFWYVCSAPEWFLCAKSIKSLKFYIVDFSCCFSDFFLLWWHSSYLPYSQYFRRPRNYWTWVAFSFIN